MCGQAPFFSMGTLHDGQGFTPSTFWFFPAFFIMRAATRALSAARGGLRASWLLRAAARVMPHIQGSPARKGFAT
jgi:hypothetical protein